MLIVSFGSHQIFQFLYLFQRILFISPEHWPMRADGLGTTSCEILSTSKGPSKVKLPYPHVGKMNAILKQNKLVREGMGVDLTV